MRTRAFDLSDPFANQECRGNGNRDMNVSFSAADLVEDEAFCLQGVTPDIAIESGLYRFAHGLQIAFDVPNKMKIDLGVRSPRHGSKPAESGSGIVVGPDPAP